MGQSKITNQEKLEKLGTQDDDKQTNKQTIKHTHTIQTTDNVYMTCALLQITGGKDEPNIVCIRKSYFTSQHGTKNVKIHKQNDQLVLYSCSVISI